MEGGREAVKTRGRMQRWMEGRRERDGGMYGGRAGGREGGREEGGSDIVWEEGRQTGS